MKLNRRDENTGFSMHNWFGNVNEVHSYYLLEPVMSPKMSNFHSTAKTSMVHEPLSCPPLNLSFFSWVSLGLIRKSASVCCPPASLLGQLPMWISQVWERACHEPLSLETCWEKLAGRSEPNLISELKSTGEMKTLVSVVQECKWTYYFLRTCMLWAIITCWEKLSWIGTMVKWKWLHLCGRKGGTD